MSWVISCAVIGSGVKRVGEGRQSECEQADWRGERGEGVTTERIARVKTGGEWWQGLGQRCNGDKDWSEDEDWSGDDSDHTAWCARLGVREARLGGCE